MTCDKTMHRWYEDEGEFKCSSCDATCKAVECEVCGLEVPSEEAGQDTAGAWVCEDCKK